MAQIFISHSQRDEQAKNFFYRAFSGTAVLPNLDGIRRCAVELH